METPFVYGKIASESNFTDRTEETKRLVGNFLSHTNTILISPRRWGKTSLVVRAAAVAAKKNKALRFCFIDLYNVRTEEQFYQVLAREVIMASTSKWEERIEIVKKYLSRLVPKITVSPGPDMEFSLTFDWGEVKKQPDDILNLAENISTKKKVNFVICIDEFQNISGFVDALAIQKKLRSHWQKHQQTSYCLYGSKRHMMMDIFTSSGMPFYKFGDVLLLQKISESDLMSFIIERFASTGKKIGEENARQITQTVECHPYYVQQLAQLTWLRSGKTCLSANIDEAQTMLMMQLEFIFQTTTEELSNTQVNFLKALISEASRMSAKKTLEEFQLGTSANIVRIKRALENKEIIDVSGSSIEFLDPLYKQWLKKSYFRI